jgi:gluconolactonase
MTTRRVLATDLEFPEGPVHLGPDRIAFVEIRGQRVSLYEHGAVRTIAVTGGGPNGATLGADGALYVANNGGLSYGPHGRWMAVAPVTGRIQRVTLDGDVRDVAVRLPGAPPNRPNDICFGPDGLLYYSDPHDWENLPNVGIGRLARTTLDGEVELLAEVPLFPNGIAFGADDRLYVAQSMTQQILVMEPRPGATPSTHCTLPRGYPDGFCFDASGTLYVAGSLGDVLWIFAPDGSVREEIAFDAGDEPTNCCLGDGRLYVTCSGAGRLEALDIAAEPLPLYPARATRGATPRSGA